MSHPFTRRFLSDDASSHQSFLMTKISPPCAKTSSKMARASLSLARHSLNAQPHALISVVKDETSVYVEKAAISAKVDREEFPQQWRQIQATPRATEDNDRDELRGFAVLSLGANFQQSRDDCANCACNESQRRRTRTYVVVGFTSKWDTKLFLGCF